ncbi:MAG: SDR family oxidoreductase [Bacteroidales bacterium]|nr:SDR family oxidoreductase [Bacteroidales bacterium]
MGKIVCITGATSGIGRSCAFRFAESGCSIILIGRRSDRLSEIETDLKSKFEIQVHSIELDVTNRQNVVDAVNSLPDRFREIDVLINNAGLALGLEPMQDGNPENWDRMIDTNVKGLLNISHAVMPLMIKQGRGHIINIGSIAGREVYPKGNVYCATKAAVDSLTRAMRIDLLPYGIRVTQIAPGAVETEFSLVRFNGDAQKANSVYNGFEPLHPDDVADVVFYAAGLPPHININDLLLMPTAQAAATQIHRT